MKGLDHKVMKKFLKLAGARLSGDWVLLGGTLLPALGVDHRVTIDIDLAHKDQDGSQTLELMQIAEDLGLPVETINQAGAFFLYRMNGFENKIILIQEGKTAKIYRPNLELYILLKSDRMSESDLDDCLAYLKWSKQNDELVGLNELVKVLGKKGKKLTSEKVTRLDLLIDKLKSEIG